MKTDRKSIAARAAHIVARILVIILALAAAAIVVGCGGGGDDDEDEHVDTPKTTCANPASCK